ncbi:uncharacterized protein BTUAT1_25480 [Bacillus altitudinis]|uniref:hypothetical protein n=1 Tax=Bacillus TaxID=1386 RepID=UPI0007207CDA|nr:MULTISPECIES: hypothetical protein [Bacillus]QCU19879.1 hypothetical protein BPGQ101_13685 [Bacillus altitudinis]UDB49879.1 hypothetical protein BWL10_11055 [Bacillus safensis]BAT49682.1 uncharacterized protein BTUAT1_25480 [Bacillus pumilus]
MTRATVRYIDEFIEDRENGLGYKRKKQGNSVKGINKNNEEYTYEKDDLDKIISQLVPLMKQLSNEKLESKSSSFNSKGVVTLTEKDFNIMGLFKIYYSITSIIITTLILLTILNIIPIIAGVSWSIITLSFILGIYKGEREWKEKHGSTKY